MRTFNNPGVAVQSWYAALPARALRRGRSRTVFLLDRNITLFRTPSGSTYALDSRCPHLGADLGLGTVDGETLRCSFHGWTFDGSGACLAGKTAARAYPVEERYGMLWLFNGPLPLFPLPAFAGRQFALPPQMIGCHPHLVAANGLDLTHYEPLHRIALLDAPVLQQPDAFRTSVSLRIRFNGLDAVDRFLRAMGGDDVNVVFTTHGGNMATIAATLGRISIGVLFTHRPEGPRSHSRTFVFAPARRHLPLVLLVLARIVRGDRRILDRIEFRPNLTESDWPLAAFISQVERMQTYPLDQPVAREVVAERQHE